MRTTFIKITVVALSAIMLSSCGAIRNTTGNGKKNTDNNTETSVATSDNPGLPGKIITVTERDPNGKKIVHDGNFKVVDPNSDLDLSINRNALLKEVSDSSAGENLIDKLEKLEEIISEEAQALKIVEEAISAYELKGDFKSKLARLGKFTQVILDDEGLEIYEALLDPDTTIRGQYVNLFVVAREKVKRLSAEIKDEASKKGIYIQLGGWIQNKEETRAVHISGFDDIAPSPFRVEQFQIVLTEAQRKEVQEFGAIAQRANTEGLSDALNAKKTLENLIVKILETESAKKIETLQKNIQLYTDDVSIQLGAIRQKLEDSHVDLDTHRKLIQSVISKYQTPETEDASTLLLDINSDIAMLAERSGHLKKKLTATAAEIKTSIHVVVAGSRVQINAISDQLVEIASTVEADIKKFEGDVKNAVLLIIHGERFTQATYEFAKEVKKISFADLPQQGTLNLDQSGERDIGDILTIKMVVGKSDGTKTEVASLRYHLYFCTPYIRTAVNFLFTDPQPLFEHPDNKSLFHYAPSYSFLLKGFWKNAKNARKKLPYHNLFAPGIGINVATVDFNSDGAPEVAFGGVFSIFRDFLQVGYGFNTFDGRGYSFFGLKLPVGSLALR
jgi:hypothetical protein